MKNNYITSKNVLLILLAFFSSTEAFSQIKLDENKVNQFAKEVFLSSIEYTTPEHLELYKDQIRRISILKTAEINADTQLQSIFSLSLKNKYNPSLQYDNGVNFIPSNFNPLKYFFPNSDAPLYYKINGTDYIIQVNPL